MLRRILVSDSDTVDSLHLLAHLATESFDVEWQTRGRIALDRCETDRFDVVVVGEVLFDMSGLALCHYLRLRDASVPLIFLCRGKSHHDRVAALGAGADDCLGRPFDPEELSARIHALLRRSELSGKLRSRTVGSMRLDHNTRRVYCCGNSFDLSTREFDLLIYFASRPHRVLTRDEILSDVWGTDFNGNTNVVDVYVGYLRRKLSDVGCEHQIETIRGSGYRYHAVDREAAQPTQSFTARRRSTTSVNAWIAPSEESAGASS